MDIDIEEGDGDWSYASTHQGMSRIIDNYQMLQRGKEGSFLKAPRKHVAWLKT